MPIESLFKYSRINEYSESLFTTPTIWFSSPSALNDPFECRPWFTFNGSEDQFLDLLSVVARRRFPEYSPEQISNEAKRLYAEGRHKDSQFERKFRSGVVQMLASHIGLCCLSASNRYILMWSHYAAEHTGFCLEFAATDYTPFFGEAQEVKYADNFPEVDFFNTPHDEQVDLIFLTKFAGWRYESEYRVIDHQAGSGLHTYPAELLKSVTFGLRMSEENKNNIRKWLSVRGTHVKLYQASIDQREFKIILTDTT